jgi:hypothetical protein
LTRYIPGLPNLTWLTINESKYGTPLTFGEIFQGFPPNRIERIDVVHCRTSRAEISRRVLKLALMDKDLSSRATFPKLQKLNIDFRMSGYLLGPQMTSLVAYELPELVSRDMVFFLDKRL